MAETMTVGVTGKVALPLGAAEANAAPAPRASFGEASTRPFHATDPRIRELIRAVLDAYEAAPFSADASHKALARWLRNATHDTPLFFARGSERARALARLPALPFRRAVATPRLVTVSMVDDSTGRVDVEGVLEYYPRMRAAVWPLRLLLPEAIRLHATWCIIARGEDDKVISVTETLHNVPKAPRALRSALASVTSAVALALGL